MNMPRHAVDVDRRQLGLDERAGVALELSLTCIPSSVIQSAGTFFSKFATFVTSTISVSTR